VTQTRNLPTPAMQECRSPAVNVYRNGCHQTSSIGVWKAQIKVVFSGTSPGSFIHIPLFSCWPFGMNG
jgi:hypothetical protein